MIFRFVRGLFALLRLVLGKTAVPILVACSVVGGLIVAAGPASATAVCPIGTAITSDTTCLVPGTTGHSVSFTVETIGGGGGGISSSQGWGPTQGGVERAGNGAIVTTVLSLVAGNALTVSIGQGGGDDQTGNAAGGGGGSSAVSSTGPTLLTEAGGGGGAGWSIGGSAGQANGAGANATYAPYGTIFCNTGAWGFGAPGTGVGGAGGVAGSNNGHSANCDPTWAPGQAGASVAIDGSGGAGGAGGTGKTGGVGGGVTGGAGFAAGGTGGAYDASILCVGGAKCFPGGGGGGGYGGGGGGAVDADQPTAAGGAGSYVNPSFAAAAPTYAPSAIGSPGGGSDGSAGGTAGQVTFNLAGPDVVTANSAPTGITGSAATVHSLVNADGSDTSAIAVEYSTSPTLASGVLTASLNPTTATGSADTAITGTITGLNASTTYYYRALATNAGGTTLGQIETFTTATVVAPAITSVNHASATAGVAMTPFTVTTSGSPTVSTITVGAGVPAGVSLDDNGDGTATISGTPATGGVYAFTLTASNGVDPDATQVFTLTVAAATGRLPQSQTLQSHPRVRSRGTTVINTRNAVTVQGQPMIAHVASFLRSTARGDFRCISVMKGPKRRVSVTLSGFCAMRVRVTYTAPGNATYYPYSRTFSYTTKRVR